MKTFLRALPGVESWVASDYWRLYRHLVSLRSPRENSNFTGFLRLPTQFEALAGPVVDFLIRDDRAEPLKVAIVGCSNGAEAYTVASVLNKDRPEINYSVLACDLEHHVIEKARTGSYLAETEVFNNKRLTNSFVSDTFDVTGETFRIKSEVRDRLSFFVADVLDASALAAFGRADIVYAQNFLFHLSPKSASIAFDNLCGILNARAALFIDGTDIPLRNRMTRKHGLSPLDYKIEQIHDEARLTRAVGWPYHYWGLEPFLTRRRDWKRRYSTIFLKDET